MLVIHRISLILLVAMVGLYTGARAEDRFPECPLESAIARSAPKRIAQPLQLPADVAAISYALTGPLIAIDAEYDGSGRLACASPVAGSSVYWPYAIAALPQQASRPIRQVFEFEEPGTARRRENNSGTGNDLRPCDEGVEVTAALERGSRYLNARRLNEATQCVDMAIRRSPDSSAAHFLRAILAGQLKDARTNIEEYRQTIALLPMLYEAELSLGQTQWLSGDLGAAEITFQGLAAKTPPLPAQAELYSRLMDVYDSAKRRRDAADAAVHHLDAERQIHLRYPKTYSQAMLAFDSRTLAIRQEEVGEYGLSAKYFAESVKWSYNERVSEAVRFEADLGRARSLRRLGEPKAALSICDEWHRRIKQVDPQLNNAHWGGRSVVQAQWEFACGDFDKGLRLLQRDMRRRPSSDTAYLALEEAYRSRGQSDQADEFRSMGDRVRATHDRALLESILREADELAKNGSVITISK